MEIAGLIKSVVLPALLISLIACGDPDEVYEEFNAGNAPANASMLDATPESQPAEEPVEGLPTPEVEQFVTSACGSLPLSTAVQSNTMSAPTVMTTGQLVSGIIESAADSTTNNVHYWSIALEPGDYHVVLDSKRANDESSSLGLRLSELHANGGVTDRLNEGGVFDYRSRKHGFFSVPVARTMLLRLTPNFGEENYTFGIFANGSAVPSPFFSDCPTIKPLSVDTTEVLLLPQEGSSTGDRWYQVNLEAGTYTLSSQAVRNDGSTGRVLYKITQVDQFGQIGRTVEFGSVDEIASVTMINSADLIRDNDGPVWIRIQNLSTEVTLEFSISSGV